MAKQGKMTETIAQLQEATRLAPEFADAFHNLAGALDRVGRLEEAIAAARRSVRLEPRNAQYHRTLDACCENMAIWRKRQNNSARPRACAAAIRNRIRSAALPRA